MQDLDAQKATLDALRPIPEDRLQRIMQKLRLEWNYHSNAIEGNSLTMGETRVFIYFGLTAGGKPLRDHLEMKGHNEALKKLEQIAQGGLKITENLIRDFHRMIVVGPGDGRAEINPGEWKTLPNYLYTQTGERLDFEPPEAAPRLMNELINWTNNCLYPDELNRHNRKSYELHPLEIACLFHLRFIRIHPFGDGNGRIARIFLNLVLMLKGYMPVIFRLEDKRDYFLALDQSTENNYRPLALFTGRALRSSMETAIRGAMGESLEEEAWIPGV